MFSRCPDLDLLCDRHRSFLDRIATEASQDRFPSWGAWVDSHVADINNTIVPLLDDSERQSLAGVHIGLLPLFDYNAWSSLRPSGHVSVAMSCGLGLLYPLNWYLFDALGFREQVAANRAVLDREMRRAGSVNVQQLPTELRHAVEGLSGALVALKTLGRLAALGDQSEESGLPKHRVSDKARSVGAQTGDLQFSFVLLHELAHVIRGHLVRATPVRCALPVVGEDIVVACWGGDDELDADAYACEVLSRAFPARPDALDLPLNILFAIEAFREVSRAPPSRRGGQPPETDYLVSSGTHPPAMVRRENLRRWLGDASGWFSTIVSLLEGAWGVRVRQEA